MARQNRWKWTGINQIRYYISVPAAVGLSNFSSSFTAMASSAGLAY
jgi:hypothetical protein